MSDTLTGGRTAMDDERGETKAEAMPDAAEVPDSLDDDIEEDIILEVLIDGMCGVY